MKLFCHIALNTAADAIAESTYGPTKRWQYVAEVNE